MEAFFAAIGEKPFRASQMLKWLHQGLVDQFDVMTNISKDLRQKLGEVAEIKAPEIVSDLESHDGTRKWLMRVDAVNCVETVFIPEKDRNLVRHRARFIPQRTVALDRDITSENESCDDRHSTCSRRLT